MSTLRLLMKGDWPDLEQSCAWVLSSSAGAVLSRGEGPPASWPAAASCEVILTADQLLLLRARLPAGRRGRTPAALGYSVEEFLLEEPERYRFLAGALQTDGFTPVLAVAKQRMQRIGQALAQVGRRARWITAESLVAPVFDGQWTLVLEAERGFLMQGPARGFAFDTDEAAAVPVELDLALQQSPGRDVRVYLGPEVRVDAAAWEARLGAKFLPGGSWDPLLVPRGAAPDLAAGEFAGTSSLGRAAPRWLAAGAVVLGIWALAVLGHWGWLSYRSMSLAGAQRAVALAAFPQAPPGPDVLVTAQSQLDQLRRSRGLMGESDLLPLLAEVLDALGRGPQLRRLDYGAGRLELSLSGQGPPPGLEARLRLRGLRAVVRSAAQGGAAEFVLVVLRTRAR